MFKDKRSFFERLTGTVTVEDEDRKDIVVETHSSKLPKTKESKTADWIEEETSEGELAVDVFNTPDDIVIKTMVAGVKPDDLDINITRDMVTIKGSREETREIAEDNYYYKELYWGSFSRTIVLPQEIEVEEAEATERHGLLTIRLPKVNKEKQTKLRVKSSA